MKKIFLTLLTLFCLVGCNDTNIVIENNEVEDIKPIEIIEKQDTVVSENPLEIHFIDVGQADSILIKVNDKSMLIDAGNNDDAELIKNYLKKQLLTENIFD